MTRRQCKSCPWKVTTDPRRDIPNYSEQMHRHAVGSTIAEPGLASLGRSELRIMACHETVDTPCAGWLANQLGPGHNLGIRMAVAAGEVDCDFELDGPQHERFEDTLPRSDP
jgi:hypothetical protein